ncbi:GIY-YIG nuclease family protein [Arsenophonus nasoniae]|uniref:GIY-YIG nuclease family protein n=1 Tax=Arsenophonus nasoniae TaxID=638 RepID=UPI00387A46FE
MLEICKNKSIKLEGNEEKKLKTINASIPNLPGVYLFFGENELLPIYIGKSINLKKRVLSHFYQKNMKLIKQIRYIYWQTTAGEIGALLLEAKLIKLYQPVFNKQLRKYHELCAFQISNNKIDIVYAKEIDFSKSENLYGLYKNRFSALKKLKSIADENNLCYAKLGMEEKKKSGCFRLQLGYCRGVRVNKESHECHHNRLLHAFKQHKLAVWPYKGAIGIAEKGVQQTQIHIVNNWVYLGSVENLSQTLTFNQATDKFDHDMYKILCCRILDKNINIIPL